MRHALLLAATLIALTACGTTKTSDPTPTTTSNPTTRLLPPRPRDLDLTGINPCTDVLTRDQLRQLAYDLGYERSPLPDKSGIHDGPTCTYSSSRPSDQRSRDIGALISISTSEGAEVWLTDPNRRTSRTRQSTVAGFPALVRPNPNFVDACAVFVDVHDGQYLEVDGSPSGGAHGTSPDPYCVEAERVAGMVIQTLSSGQ